MAARPDGSILLDQLASHATAFAVEQATVAPPGTVSLAEFCEKAQLKFVKRKQKGDPATSWRFVRVSPVGRTSRRSFCNSKLLWRVECCEERYVQRWTSSCH